MAQTTPWRKKLQAVLGRRGGWFSTPAPPGDERGSWKCGEPAFPHSASGGSSRSPGGPRPLNLPTRLYARGIPERREGTFIYLLPVTITFEPVPDRRRRMGFVLPAGRCQGPTPVGHPTAARLGAPPSPCLSSLVDIPALETRSRLLSHFRISFWGSRNTCPLIACHSASGPG